MWTSTSPTISMLPVLRLRRATSSMFSIRHWLCLQQPGQVCPNLMANTEANDIDLIQTYQDPGWLHLEGHEFAAAVHGSGAASWSIWGTLAEKFPVDDLRLDPLIFTYKYPDNFAGPFNGTIGKDKVSLAWAKSGATMSGGGKRDVGDIEFKGETKIHWRYG
ncbi:MAG: hypothetical protein Q9226_004657 [Calogaya cf. arnoldii]